MWEENQCLRKSFYDKTQNEQELGNPQIYKGNNAEIS